MLKIRTIAVILCDNDFGITFTNLLETIMRAINYHNGSKNELKKEDIEKIIYEGIRFHYLAFQKDNTGLETDKERLEYILSYLKEGVKIYFDDEAEEFISNNDHDGGSWYLETITGKVYYF